MSVWYYCRNGLQHGPITIDELKEKIVQGQLADTCQVWKAGSPEWIRVAHHPELASSLPTAKPPSATGIAVFGSCLGTIRNALRRARSPGRSKTLGH